MDYTQPPAYIEVVSQNPTQNCQATLERLKRGNLGQQERIKLQFLYPASLEDRLSAFPKKGAMPIPNLDIKISPPHPFLYRFYKYPESKREWDIALVITPTGTPIGLYYIRGEVVQEFSMVIPPDIIIDFYGNPLEALDKKFDLYKLEMYIREVIHTCASDLRSDIGKVYNSNRSQPNKENQREVNPKESFPKIKKQNFKPNSQIRLRQKR